MISLAALCWSTWALASSAHAHNLQQRQDRPAPVYSAAVDQGKFGTYPVRKYKTEPDLQSPQTNFLAWDARCDDGSVIMITPRGGEISRPGPMLLDGRGELIWTKHFDNDYGGQAYGLDVQTFGDEDYLTFWLGDDGVKGHGAGSYYMLNASYDVVHKIDAMGDLDADLHEFHITPEGTALLTVYEIIEYDITKITRFGPDEQAPPVSFIWDCIVQEIDLESNQLLFQWRASEHVRVADSYRDIVGGSSTDDPFDYFHMNSVEKDTFGNYLVSSRYMHSIYYIDRQSGEILWTLGGKRNDFLDLSDGRGLGFAWQHDARIHSVDAFPTIYRPSGPSVGTQTTLLSMFDNAAEDGRFDYGTPFSRGLLLEISYPNQPHRDVKRRAGSARREIAEIAELDTNARKILEINGTNEQYTVRVIQEFVNPNHLRSWSQGSMQVIEQEAGLDPKVFVGYGMNAAWTEFDADGSVLCDVHFGADTSFDRGDVQSYRARKGDWVGQPTHAPSIVSGSGQREVLVSWNGATEVTDWILQCSDEDIEDDDAWDDVEQIPKFTFETTISLRNFPTDSRYLRVIALDGEGQHLAYGTTRAIRRDPSFWAVYDEHLGLGYGAIVIFLVLTMTASALVAMHQFYSRRVSKQTQGWGLPSRMWHKGVKYMPLRS